MRGEGEEGKGKKDVIIVSSLCSYIRTYIHTYLPSRDFQPPAAARSGLRLRSLSFWGQGLLCSPIDSQPLVSKYQSPSTRVRSESERERERVRESVCAECCVGGQVDGSIARYRTQFDTRVRGARKERKRRK